MSTALADAERYLRDLEARGEWREIRIMTEHGWRKKKAWCVGVFAVHAMQNYIDRFVITHMPTGTNLNRMGVFRAVDHAMPAALALVRMNGGEGLDRPEVLRRMKDEVAKIFADARALPDEEVQLPPPVVIGVDFGREGA
jgi:hypothetical protein